MQVEYELDQWEWQGVTRSIEIDPNDYAGMSAGEIKDRGECRASRAGGAK